MCRSYEAEGIRSRLSIRDATCPSSSACRYLPGRHLGRGVDGTPNGVISGGKRVVSRSPRCSPDEMLSMVNLSTSSSWSSRACLRPSWLSRRTSSAWWQTLPSRLSARKYLPRCHVLPSFDRWGCHLQFPIHRRPSQGRHGPRHSNRLKCVKGSNVVERFCGHTTENASRLGYKHVCVNYLHVASPDYQKVILHTHTPTHTHSIPTAPPPHTHTPTARTHVRVYMSKCS